MYQDVNKSDFTAEFHRAGRGGQFTYKALCTLYDYITALEEDTGENIELDVIAICCEWAEGTIQETLESYNLGTLEELEDRTTVIKLDNENILYQQF